MIPSIIHMRRYDKERPMWTRVSNFNLALTCHHKHFIFSSLVDRELGDLACVIKLKKNAIQANQNPTLLLNKWPRTILRQKQ